MNFNQYLDIYCERTAFGYLNEPLNLFSNLSFFVAGIFILKNTKFHTYEPAAVWFGWLAIAVGIGSSLFHSFATVWSQLADVIPIGILVVYYLLTFSSKVLGLNRAGVVVLSLLLIGLSWAFIALVGNHATNGSASYFGVTIVLFILAGMDWRLGKRKVLFAAGGVFSLALLFRTFDHSACQYNPYGLHFIWHLLNGVTIYLLSQRYAKQLP